MRPVVAAAGLAAAGGASVAVGSIAGTSAPAVGGRRVARVGRRRIAGRSLRRWLVDALLLVVCVVCVAYEPVSIAIHSVIGLVFAAAVGPHLWDRRTWIRGTWRRVRERRALSSRHRWITWQAVLLFLLVAVVTGSGLWDWLVGPTKIRFHAISSVILIGVLAWHTWTRRRSLVARMTRRPEADPVRAATPPHE